MYEAKPCARKEKQDKNRRRKALFTIFPYLDPRESLKMKQGGEKMKERERRRERGGDGREKKRGLWKERDEEEAGNGGIVAVLAFFLTARLLLELCKFPSFQHYIGALRRAVHSGKLTLGLLEVLHQVGDGADLDVPLPRELDALLAPQHTGLKPYRLAFDLGAIIYDLADDGGGVLSGEPAEVDGSLGVAGALADAALFGLEGQDVAGAAEGGDGGVGVGKGAAGEGAVVGGDAGGDGRVAGVHGDGVGGAADVLGAGDHLRQLEGLGAGGEDGGADVARGVADHEGELLGRGVFRGEDEICFIFAPGVV